MADPSRNPAKGDDPYTVAKVRGQVIRAQNKIIVSARGAWSSMKKTYSEGPTLRRRIGF